jgi:hypothetical protein
MVDRWVRGGLYDNESLCIILHYWVLEINGVVLEDEDMRQEG